MLRPRTLLLLVPLSALLMGGSCSFGGSSGGSGRSGRGVVVGGCRGSTGCETPPPTGEEQAMLLGARAVGASESAAPEEARAASAALTSLRGPAPRSLDDPAGPGATVPEPRAGVAFAIGALLCLRQLRRRRSPRP